MLSTYKAILRGNHLEWSNEVPKEIVPNVSIVVLVTVLEDISVSETINHQGQRMARALEQLAAKDVLKDIPDPVVWQREIRQDRVLPGRNT